MSAALDVRKCFALASLFACGLPRLVASKASVIAERANIIRQSEASVGRSPSCAKMRRAKYRTQASVSAKKEKARKVRAYLFVVRSPRLELGRCNHTPLKRTRLPIPP